MHSKTKQKKRGIFAIPIGFAFFFSFFYTHTERNEESRLITVALSRFFLFFFFWSELHSLEMGYRGRISSHLNVEGRTIELAVATGMNNNNNNNKRGNKERAVGYTDRLVLGSSPSICLLSFFTHVKRKRNGFSRFIFIILAGVHEMEGEQSVKEMWTQRGTNELLAQ